jgi:D-alanyl-D-alanine carboxypeptidase (penicillin-binding protein 5/6)
MQSITTITANRKSSLVRRLWRPAAGVAAVAALAVAGLAQPWQHDQNTMSSAARDTSVSSSGTAPKSSSHTKTANGGTIKTTVALKAPGSTPQLSMPRAGAAIMAVDGIGTMDSKSANTVLSTASVAKAMTAYQVLKDHPLKAGWYGPKITVTKAEASLFNKQARQGQSLVPVRAGEKITERDALEALLLASANNMAQILARWDGGTVPHFVDKMNASAKALGMSHTHYTDPSGFTPSTKSTVADQIKLASGALKVQQYYAITSLRNAWIPVKGHIINFNKMLSNKNVIGLKTGSMNAAGGCLLFAAKYKVNGKPVTLVSAVFHQYGPNGILTAVFDSSSKLLDSAHKSLGTYKVVKKGQVVGAVPGTAKHLVATKDVSVAGFAGMTVKAQLSAKVDGATKAGANVGTLKVAGTSIPVTVK